MGNWVEEEALRRDTGYSRYKTWTPKEGMGVSHPRVIAHTDAVDAKDYRASSKASSFADFAVPPNVGPRERRRLEELHAQAKLIKQAAKDADQDNDPTARESTNQASYKAHDPAYVAHGVVRVLPRGRGGFKDFDPSVVGKTRREVAAADAAKLQGHVEALPHQATVTRYSHALTSGSDLTFPSSAAAPSRNPFGRSTAFTNDIHDARVVHGEASDPGAEASPGIGINLQARAAVLKLKQWLQASPAKRSALARLTESNRHDLNSITPAQLSRGLHDVGLPLLEKDALQVFTYLDKEQVGRITWVALFDLLDA
ncbi:hypothetical protein H310_14382 [Aphanomyces invadans]|uniref:Uncharacterized protein n=1 Tax=Aphanomyces invadans TaxID=157072 RepID=A0A024TA84_9STRA|nr:hypothetical protein H310_14382 [Aphanomyces invadans]ETV90889.1 hypothetical protein H310_14382 [Aphanomyces invadans]|eukprot:XP_008880454.1 hypothetical protein H310_14382 [Aphanomyces invadans]